MAALEDAGSATRGRPTAGGGGGSRVRRSRSLSRFPPPSPPPEDAATPSSRFVNKVRGGGRGGLPPEISLDDLADEFFRARAESEDDEDEDAAVARGRPRYPAPAEKGGGGGRRSSTARYARETESSRQRERSVSRPPAQRRGVAANAVSGGPAARRQRYASVDRRASMDRHRWCDSDNDMEVSHRYVSRGIHTKSSSGNSLQNSFIKPSKANHALKRSTSQKDFFHSRDSSSSHSSLTDDESRSSHSFYIKNQKAACAVYGLDKTVTKSEPSEKVLSSDAQPPQVITELRRSYTNKLEESEKRKQELLAQLAAEEQHGHELTKIVRELLPTTKKTANLQRQPRHRRRSNDRSKMSKRLTEEAEQYFEDFLSNVEDTDFSSFDGERSDTSSTKKDVLHNAMIETPVALPKVGSPSEEDGLVLPWLEWETTNDLQTSPCKTKAQGESTACSTSNQTVSSRGSWSPGDYATSTASKDKVLARFEEVGIRQSSCPHFAGTSSFHIDDYLHLRQSEDLLFEKWRQKQRIESGGLFLCSRPTIL
ncbi:serine/arginine repetitive matrix protein 2-like isoform X2 [Panicum virgatum]|uniref:serine/arginine repetitive matrix protein 2-like isoform X2 n=1 Tax=Panicum virgatum TaxID=38727 RepID=UPI0019D50AFB|nr:serine/arginine repetitive matrix protein 2-like isoform X2 [Panicum virgatum]